MRIVSDAPVGQEEGRASKGCRTACCKDVRHRMAWDSGRGGEGEECKSLLEHEMS